MRFTRLLRFSAFLMMALLVLPQGHFLPAGDSLADSTFDSNLVTGNRVTNNLLITQLPVTNPPSSQSQPTPLFREVSEEAGIDLSRLGTEKVIGQAWGDFNNDGWLDFYVTDHAGPNTLYLNNRDGSFSQSSLTGQVALPEQYSAGAVFIDYDNDGWRDLFVLNWGQNILFQNFRGLAFVNVTESAGVGDTANGKTASWGDYDQDGFVDLYVANWSCYPRCGRPSIGDPDRLYHNNGDGTFSDVSRLLGSKTVGSGFVASFIDYDNDEDLDIYLVNDEFLNPIGNILWRNDGPGCDGWCFSEVSQEAGANTTIMGMGLATGDYDNDLDLDFYFSNAGPMTLLQNQGDGSFLDVAPQAGVDTPLSIGWGTVFFDYDNDGWQDLYLAVAEAAKDGSPANPLFRNNGDGTFTDIGPGSGVGNPGTSLGVAYSDYDHDGWVDLVVGNYDEGYHLYHNEVSAGSDNHWLALELTGSGPVNRDAVGARVYVTTAAGQQMREISAGSSLGAGNTLRLYFGLAQAAVVDELVIVWPDGLRQNFSDISGDRLYRLPYPVDETAESAQQLALYGPAPEPPGFMQTTGVVCLGLILGIILGLISLKLYDRRPNLT